MNPSRGFQAFVRQNKMYLLFFIWFAVLFFLGQTLYLATYDKTRKILVDFLHVRPSVVLINHLMPDENARASGNTILGKTSLLLKRGCDGADSFLLLLAALLAFPMKPGRKILGAVLGSVVMYACNLLRIVVLYKIVRIHPAWFEAAHIYFGQIFIIVAGTLFFIFWVQPVKQTQPS